MAIRTTAVLTLGSMFASAATAVASPYSDAVLASNPNSYWRLDDATGTAAVDSSGNGHTGTYSATGVTYGVAGATADGDKAVSFDGSSGVMTGAYAATPSFTVEAWAKSASANWNQNGW